MISRSQFVAFSRRCFTFGLYEFWRCFHYFKSTTQRITTQNRHQWQSKLSRFCGVSFRIFYAKIGFIGNSLRSASQDNKVQPCNFRFKNHSVTSLRGRIISIESYSIGKQKESHCAKAKPKSWGAKHQTTEANPQQSDSQQSCLASIVSCRHTKFDSHKAVSRPLCLTNTQK